MTHVSQIAKDLFNGVFRTSPFCVDDVSGQELRRNVDDCHSCDAGISRFVFRAEKIRTYRCASPRLQVGMHMLVPAVADRVSVVPLSAGYAALASQMIRDVGQAVSSELLHTHAF